jgi:sugar/nucleoside kinase (ribokinase family)/phosphoglycolate phosphatase-like HAD superfamily hydrolase
MNDGVLSPERLRLLLASMGNARVGVIGDFCLDVYWMLDLRSSERSVETGKMTRPVRRQRYSLGGAGNVVANLSAIEVGHVHAFGVVGSDPFGVRLLELLRARGVDVSGMLTLSDEEAWQTLCYCKPYVDEDEEPRLDMGNFNRLPESAVDRLLAALEQALPRLDVLVVNEQVASGIHTPYLQDQLCGLMQRHPQAVFMFDGRHLPHGYPDAWLKVNAAEAVALCGVREATGDLVLREDAEQAARALYARRGKPVLVTRGARGCVLCDAQGIQSVPGLQVLGPVDPVGGGDSFLSGLAAAAAAGAAPVEAMEIGNFAARVTVTKLRQTGTASPAEVLDVGLTPQYIHRPEVADDPRQARFVAGTQIEILEALPADLSLRYAVFDHDGTVSTLRQGWEEVMEPLMIQAAMGERFGAADEALYRRVADRIRQFIDQTTGVQTLVQMQGLVEIVHELGMVPADQILDLHGYKAIYTQALAQRLEYRLERLRCGELSAADFTLKNAVPFVAALQRAGIVCCLASGTDQNDVRAEAAALGYAHLFSGGIYGAVGDVAKDAKREVLERIMADIGDIRGRLVTFGDGPVEMRETRRRGGLPVGVASDEVRRFDLNPAKRARLIRAGAALVIPDFSQADAVMKVLRVGS